MKLLVYLFLAASLISSCAVQKKYNPQKKFSPAELQQDFTLFRAMLEEAHPGLYWFTPKDSMDYYFTATSQRMKDSMTESKFRYLLSYVTSKIRCGHTSVMPSKEASKYADRMRSLAFPLTVKVWQDTAIVTSNLNRKDSVVKRGVLLTSVEGRPLQVIMDSFFNHLSTDGYNLTHKYQSVSNGGSFRNLYGSIYGLRQKMAVQFIDSAGKKKSAMVDLYNPAADTPVIRPAARRISAWERKKIALQSQRSLRIDTAMNTAVMQVNTFTKGNQLRSFFRQSFRKLKKEKISNLVIDLRGNGGGSVTLSNLLTRYIADKPFKIADSLYAITRSTKYARYRDENFFTQLFFFFFTRKQKDGTSHFTMYEGKYFKPKSGRSFNGTTYILTGGNTFSAASLVAASLRPQENVTIVGEETGGGSYGNTAWIIPEVTLPHTRVRFRLPLFRLVIDKDAPKGRGVLPEVEVLPTVDAIRKNADYKMEKVYELIRASRK
jgi:hypothetical protein